MDDLPFNKPGRFYKGNVHTHSTRSDGKLPPHEVVAHYRSHGYDFMALTDHFWPQYGFPITDTTPYRTEQFTTLLGAELHCEATPFGGPWHLIALGLPLDFTPTRPDETVQELTRRAAGTGAWVSLAHPAVQGLEPQDVLELEHIDAVEVYNANGAFSTERTDGWYIADAFAVRGRRIGCCAVDDAHFSGRPDSLRAFVCVKAEACTPEALLAALKARHFYTSQGPEIHDIEISDRTVTVRCSPVEAILVGGLGVDAYTYYGEPTTEHTFSLDRDIDRGYVPRDLDQGYLRVTIRDASQQRAWSNPIFFSNHQL